MLLEAPRREDRLRFPRLAARAAPAAICCFFDFAGMTLATHLRSAITTGSFPPPTHGNRLEPESTCRRRPQDSLGVPVILGLLRILVALRRYGFTATSQSLKCFSQVAKLPQRIVDLRGYPEISARRLSKTKKRYLKAKLVVQPQLLCIDFSAFGPALKAVR